MCCFNGVTQPPLLWIYCAYMIVHFLVIAIGQITMIVVGCWLTMVNWLTMVVG